MTMPQVRLTPSLCHSYPDHCGGNLAHDGEGTSETTRLPRRGNCRIFRAERFAMSDQDIQRLENQFPAVSGSAFAAAREYVLASGQSVLQSQDGIIYEVFPDGRKVTVKKIEPPTQFVSGKIFTIR